jgi:hypothetical protein
MEEIKEVSLEKSKKYMNMIDGKMVIYSGHAFSDIKFDTEDELIEHMIYEWNRCKQYITPSKFYNPYVKTKFEWPYFSPDEYVTTEYIDFMNDTILQFEINDISNIDALNFIILKFSDLIKRVSTYNFKMFIYVHFIMLLIQNCTKNEIDLMSMNRINYHRNN